MFLKSLKLNVVKRRVVMTITASKIIRINLLRWRFNYAKSSVRNTTKGISENSKYFYSVKEGIRNG